MADPDLEKLERQVEQAKARLQSARARMAEKDRKLDARRKIILGGALIELAGRDQRAVRVIITLIEGLTRKQDKKAFDGWRPPALDTKDEAGGKPEPDDRGDGSAQVRDATARQQRDATAKAGTDE